MANSFDQSDNVQSGMLIGRILPLAVAGCFLIFLKEWVKNSGLKLNHKQKQTAPSPI